MPAPAKAAPPQKRAASTGTATDPLAGLLAGLGGGATGAGGAGKLNLLELGLGMLVDFVAGANPLAGLLGGAGI
jgi:uncharacterized membrane protein YfcA